MNISAALADTEPSLVAYYLFDKAPGTATTADLAAAARGANAGYLSNGVARVLQACSGSSLLRCEELDEIHEFLRR